MLMLFTKYWSCYFPRVFSVIAPFGGIAIIISDYLKHKHLLTLFIPHPL